MFLDGEIGSWTLNTGKELVWLSDAAKTLKARCTYKQPVTKAVVHHRKCVTLVRYWFTGAIKQHHDKKENMSLVIKS